MNTQTKPIAYGVDRSDVLLHPGKCWDEYAQNVWVNLNHRLVQGTLFYGPDERLNGKTCPICGQGFRRSKN